MNEIIEKENIIIEDLIYEIRGVKVMLDSEISIAKCHNYFYDMMITHYDIGELISVFNDYVII